MWHLLTNLEEATEEADITKEEEVREGYLFIFVSFISLFYCNKKQCNVSMNRNKSHLKNLLE